MSQKSTILTMCLFLSSSFAGGQTLKASADDFDIGSSSMSKQSLLNSSTTNLEDVFAAVNAIDSESFDPGLHPKSLRGTWQDYDKDLVSDFLAGKIMTIDPVLLEKNIPWEKLTETDKKGIPAVSLMYDKNKSKMKEKEIISLEESKMSWTELSAERQQQLPAEWLLPSRTGLSDTRTIGCGQFTEDQLQEVKNFIIDYDNRQRARKLADSDDNFSYEEALAKVKAMRAAHVIETPIAIVDHREEPHLHLKVNEAVGNGKDGLIFDPKERLLPMSLYSPGDAFSKGKNNLEVERIEGKLIHKVQKHGVISLSLIMNKNMGFVQESKVKTYKMNEAYSEKTLAESLGLGYIRVPITDHHAIEVEDGNYLKIAFDSMPRGVYAIHHCRGGKGRTQTGMTTRDMMFNKENQDLTFADFIFRHVLIGGANLLGPLIGVPEKEWKKPQAYERAREIHNFYRYTRDTKEGIRTLYSDWKKQNPMIA